MVWGYECENRNVLRSCLKTASNGAAVTWAGSCECATANCGSTNDRYVQAIRAGWTQSSSWRHVCDASEAGLEITRSSAMNGRYVKTANLKEMRSGMRSQWRLMSAGEMCSERHKPNISCAVAFWISPVLHHHHHHHHHAPITVRP